jgi:hypothetical protein
MKEKGEGMFGELPRCLTLTADCGGPFTGPLHFFQVDNNSCSWIITHDTQEKFVPQIWVGFNTFTMLFNKFIGVL